MQQQTPTSSPGTPACSVLRVVDGMHQGARVSLQRSGLALIGSADDCDLILLDAGVTARHAAITLRENDVTLRAIDGQVQVDGRSIAPGEVVTLGAGTPMEIGAAKIVIGDDAIVASPPEEPKPRELSKEELIETAVVQETGQSASAADTRPPRGFEKALYAYAPWARTKRGKRIGLAAAGCLVAGAVFAATLAIPNKVIPYSGTAEERATRLVTALRLEDDIRISSPEPGVLALTGIAPDQSAHTELVRRLAEADLNPILRLSIGTQLASAVKDVFRINGLNVDAEYSHGGVVIVNGVPESNRRVAQVIEYALRDIQGLSAIHVGKGNARTVVSRSSMPAQTGPVSMGAKRVVSVVDGPPAYIVTSDGARYFVGATLPEGHRVLGISNGSVILERDGERVVMKF